MKRVIICTSSVPYPQNNHYDHGVLKFSSFSVLKEENLPKHEEIRFPSACLRIAV